MGMKINEGQEACVRLLLRNENKSLCMISLEYQI